MSTLLWCDDWRAQTWSALRQPWDLVIIGGGITGAGILREATRLGLKTLLVEQRDFAWGASSRSSKLVHGGLRYLKQGRLHLTRTSVLERERLLKEGPGLIEPLGFLFTIEKGDHVGRFIYEIGLSLYDLLAMKWAHRYCDATALQMLAPHTAEERLAGAFQYGDALTDDARLVLRVLREAAADGATALNYVTAKAIQNAGEQGMSLRLKDDVSGRTVDVTAKVVINATGPWADDLRKQVGAKPRLRRLRGSHLVFPWWRLPVAQAVSFLHPWDRRPVMIFPWEGVTLVGTTDVDHDRPLHLEPAITPEEVAYLMAATAFQFPSLNLQLSDVVATFAGLRAVVHTGKANPSEESREHVVWEERGLLTVTGGKLTTFRRIALDALKAVRHHFPGLPPIRDDTPALDGVDPKLPLSPALDGGQRRRLLGRYGREAPDLVAAARPDELSPVPGLFTLWAELRWAARAEGIVHLDDLLLRRVRMGLLLPEGGKALLPRIRTICQPELGWNDARWEAEEARYMQLWRTNYAPLPPDDVPDWRMMLTQAEMWVSSMKRWPNSHPSPTLS